MYKLLITTWAGTSYGVAIDTQVLEFVTLEYAEKVKKFLENNQPYNDKICLLRQVLIISPELY